MNTLGSFFASSEEAMNICELSKEEAVQTKSILEDMKEKVNEFDCYLTK